MKPRSEGISRAVLLLCAAIVLASLAAALGQLDRSKSPHRKDADCLICHTTNALTLMGDHAAARKALRPDLEGICNGCHKGEGPSHKTGVTPKRTVPATLPLGGQGKVECWTCHFSHGENPYGQDYVRIDNRRGGLCLSCHTIDELQQ